MRYSKQYCKKLYIIVSEAVRTCYRLVIYFQLKGKQEANELFTQNDFKYPVNIDSNFLSNTQISLSYLQTNFNTLFGNYNV